MKNDSCKNFTSDLKNLIEHIQNGNFEEVLRHCPIRIFGGGIQQSSIKEAVKHFYHENSSDETR